MSKEFEKLKKQVEVDKEMVKARHKERYQYALSLGFPSKMAKFVKAFSIERIHHLSKELENDKTL